MLRIYSWSYILSIIKGIKMPKPLSIALFGGVFYMGFALGFHYAQKEYLEKIIDYTCERITDRTAYTMCAITIKDSMRKPVDEIKALSKPGV